MKKIALIIARSINGVIGYLNDLPWGLLKDDMKSFSDLTKRGVVIMGRLTAESILKRLNEPLRYRINIVISTKPQQELQHLIVAGFIVCASLREAMAIAEGADGEKIWIIGGAQIYALAVEELIIDEIYLTEVLGEFTGDVSCPDLHLEKYEKGECIHFERNDRNVCSFNRQQYVRLQA